MTNNDVLVNTRLSRCLPVICLAKPFALRRQVRGGLVFPFGIPSEAKRAVWQNVYVLLQPFSANHEQDTYMSFIFKTYIYSSIFTSYNAKLYLIMFNSAPHLSATFLGKYVG
jgi:hypothetical protein